YARGGRRIYSRRPLRHKRPREQMASCRMERSVYLVCRRRTVIPNQSRKSECSPGRANQLHDGVCSIEQRQHGRHHEQEKSRGLGREVQMRFAREVIPAESMEGRFAILYTSATDIVERRYFTTTTVPVIFG